MGNRPATGIRYQGPSTKKFPILPVLSSVYCVTTTDTYLDMRRWLCLVDLPKSGAIL